LLRQGSGVAAVAERIWKVGQAVAAPEGEFFAQFAAR